MRCSVLLCLARACTMTCRSKFALPSAVSLVLALGTQSPVLPASSVSAGLPPRKDRPPLRIESPLRHNDRSRHRRRPETRIDSPATARNNKHNRSSSGGAHARNLRPARLLLTGRGHDITRLCEEQREGRPSRGPQCQPERAEMRQAQRLFGVNCSGIRLIILA